jgi:choline dehydrogenase
MKEAVKAMKRFVAAQAWNGYIVGPVPALADTDTDAKLEAYIRANSGTEFHPVGTAAMSPASASWGVVDPTLKVKGVEGLRVVDASVMVSCFLLLLLMLGWVVNEWWV